MTHEEEVARGKAAELLLRNELLADAFEKLDLTYTAAWKATAPGQTQEREKLFALTTALQDVRGHIEQIAVTGELARRQLGID
jgi:ketosteroid isomerase-like protein